MAGGRLIRGPENIPSLGALLPSCKNLRVQSAVQILGLITWISERPSASDVSGPMPGAQSGEGRGGNGLDGFLQLKGKLFGKVAYQRLYCQLVCAAEECGYVHAVIRITAEFPGSDDLF